MVNQRTKGGGDKVRIKQARLLLIIRLSHQTSEIVAYHKVKRKFLSLTDIEKEDPDKLQICEFRGQNFEQITGGTISSININCSSFVILCI
jgi:hypothetical protein